MRIVEDAKLDFKDVLIVPNRSSSISRKEIILKRSFCDKKNGLSHGEFIPVIAANMDTIGTFEMAKELHKHGCMTALHKHYTEDELIKYALIADYKKELKNCPFENTKRLVLKDIIKQLNTIHPIARKNMFRSMDNSYEEYLPHWEK